MSALPVAQARKLTAVGVPLLKTGALGLFFATSFFPYLVGEVTPAPYPAFAGLWLYGSAELLRRRASSWQLGLWLLGPILILIGTYYAFSLPGVVVASLGQLPAVLRDYALMLPVALVAGFLAARDPDASRFLATVRVLAAISAAMALLEWRLGRQLFPGNQVAAGFGAASGADALLADGGGLRSVVAADHPLVLATVLLAALPLALRGRRTWLRWGEALLLVGGILATDSTGPLLVAGGVVACFALSPVLAPRLARLPLAWVRGLYAAGVAVFLAGAGFVWSPVVDSGSALDDSSQYRFALFSLIPQILLTRPFGYGFGPLPRGEFLIEAQGTILDAGITVDSELVLLVIQTGVVGLIAFVLILWLGVRGMVQPTASHFGTAPLLVITLTGFVLALHVWSSLGTMWYFLIGAAAAAWWHSRSRPPVLQQAPVPAITG